MTAWQQKAESHAGQWGTFSLYRGHQLCGLPGAISNACLIFSNSHSKADVSPSLILTSKPRPDTSAHSYKVLLFMAQSSIVQWQKHCFHVLFMTFCSCSMTLLPHWLRWSPIGKPRFSLARPILDLQQRSSCLQEAPRCLEAWLWTLFSWMKCSIFYCRIGGVWSSKDLESASFFLSLMCHKAMQKWKSSDIWISSSPYERKVKEGKFISLSSCGRSLNDVMFWHFPVLLFH